MHKEIGWNRLIDSVVLRRRQGPGRRERREKKMTVVEEEQALVESHCRAVFSEGMPNLTKKKKKS